MATTRRDALQRIQDTAQKQWTDIRVFEEDAPSSQQQQQDIPPKFLVTFPYPYCNGFLHIGHAFSLSKAEFVVAYKRMKRIKCLYPFGFHCTGMPIQTCADKLKHELATYGNPPVFPQEDPDTSATTDNDNSDTPDLASADKAKAKKGKVAAKASTHRYQWQILEESGIDPELIPQFADPVNWLYYFPKQNIHDLSTFGLKTDWRRSFITTDVNPYYDSFIRWQFNHLRSLNKIKFGKRKAVYSPVDGQPCADHDRASGEGVQPQDYVLIKMRLLQLPQVLQNDPFYADRPVYLPAATLRAETMYGQTNCWVLPSGQYGVYELANRDIFICSHHSARNMAYQDLFPTFGEAVERCTVSGLDLIGLPLSAPLATYDEIYVLPLLTVSMTKGTGIVTSVPSDAPDDYRGLMDLKEKPALMEKFGLKEEWVLPFEPIPIIETPGFGKFAAVEACKRHKIKSQNDKVALAKAKDEVYKSGFYHGTLLIGQMTGRPVIEAKPKIREMLIAAGKGVAYAEPEQQVMSRSGDECVVALCDQWYLEYGEESWRSKVEAGLKKMNLYFAETRNAFEAILGWLKEWACSRQFGLGSKLPWDDDWLIESLSDSTIYMAFYTVAHLLQGGTDNLDGQKAGPAGIEPGAMSDALWDYVLLGKGNAEDVVGIDVEMLRKMRREFLYWYPVDLRVSGKDLVGNHLTFFLYNHAAIFPEEHWPQAIRVNGHVLLNAEKMSKSTGNFLTLRDAMRMYTSDGVRFALADASDGIEDANFSTKAADDTILRLWTLVDFVEEAMENIDSMETGELTRFADRVFAEQLNQRLREAEGAYEKMLFRDAAKAGFFEMQKDLGKYREAVGADKSSRAASTLGRMHRDVFLRFALYQTASLAPICPHTCEHLWGIIRGALEQRDGVATVDTVMKLEWPESEEADSSILAAGEYIQDTLSRIRIAILKPAKKKKKKKEEGATPKPTKVSVFVCTRAPEWQEVVMTTLRELFDEVEWRKSQEAHPEEEEKWWKFASDTPKQVLGALPVTDKKNKKVMPFVAMVRKEVEKLGASALDRALKFDERAVLEENEGFMVAQLAPFGITAVAVTDASEDSSSSEAMPAVPSFQLS